MQHGPGAENAFGGIAQAYGEAVPILVLPMGYPRRIAHVQPNYNSVLNIRHVTKSAEPVTSGAEVPNILRRAFTRLKCGRGAPVLVEVPVDVFDEEVPEPLAYKPAAMPRIGPDPEAVRAVATRLAEAKRPVIYAGQGVHYARAWAELKRLAELLAAPVTTSLGGKSAFPENHMLSLGSGGNAIPATVHHFLHKADLIFGIGCSFTKTNFGVDMPPGKAIVHATLDPMDINKDVACEQALIGDAKLTLEVLLERSSSPWSPTPRDPAPVADEIKAVREPWLAEWRPKLTSDEVPLNPYRVLVRPRAHGRSRQHHHHARCRQPARSALAVLGVDHAARPTSAGARPRSSATGSGSPWARSSCTPKSCASTSGATPRSASPAWISRPRCASASRSSRSCSTTSAWRSSSRSCRSRPSATAPPTSRATTPPWRARSAPTASASPTPREIIPAIRRGIAATERGEPALLEFITSKEVDGLEIQVACRARLL